MAEQLEQVFRPARTSLQRIEGGVNPQPLEVDATITASHALQADTTDHPLDDGSEVTDGVILKPILLRMDGVLDARDQDGNIGSPNDAFEQLAALVGKNLNVVTELRTYENMVMTQLEIPQDARGGGVMRFTASFKQVRFAKAKTVELIREPRATKKIDKGNQPTKTADPAVAKKSGLVQGIELFQKVVAK